MFITILGGHMLLFHHAHYILRLVIYLYICNVVAVQPLHIIFKAYNSQ